MIAALLALTLYGLGAYQAYQVINLTAKLAGNRAINPKARYYFVAFWPYVTAKDIYLDIKGHNVNE